jgi:uncharacterized protein (TIGR02452 family)
MEDRFINRIKVWQETKAAATSIAASVPPSEKLTPADFPPGPVPSRGFATSVFIENVDCIEAGLAMAGEGLNPVVLNLSDDRDAGGCVDLGSGAQEESLWRRTALCVTQLQSFYPLCAGGTVEAIYSPAVSVLRRSESAGYAWYTDTERPTMSFIACPAIKMPHWVASAEEPDGDLKDSDKMRLSKRLRLILRIAAAKGHDAVVLGAMGCGAWGNPPRAVARVFATVLPEFDGVFKQIVIAILSGGPRPHILTAFTSVFDAVLGSGSS